jgi:hypothetical protein
LQLKNARRANNLQARRAPELPIEHTMRLCASGRAATGGNFMRIGGIARACHQAFTRFSAATIYGIPRVRIPTAGPTVARTAVLNRSTHIRAGASPYICCLGSRHGLKTMIGRKRQQTACDHNASTKYHTDLFHHCLLSNKVEPPWLSASKTSIAA